MRHVLSYWTSRGEIVTRDADSGRILWRADAAGTQPRALQWSAHGKTLLVLSSRRLELLDGHSGAVLKLLSAGTGLRFTDAQVSPNGRTLALARYEIGLDRSSVYLLDVRSRSWNARQAFAGQGQFGGVRWSPNGRWLLVTWRDANQWLFLRSAPARRVLAVSRIGRAFEPDRTGTARFPAAGGWCCAP
jgi:dipeptidyl aminopeptidase/acylaminoacyl peptidase